MPDYRPSDLPFITAVDVIRTEDVYRAFPDRTPYEVDESGVPTLAWLSGDGITLDERLQAVGDQVALKVDGSDAQRIAALWRQLPPGHIHIRMSNCLYALRFRQGSVIVCRASICWDFGQIHGHADNVDFGCLFNSRAEPSQALLAELNRLAPRVKRPQDGFFR